MKLVVGLGNPGDQYRQNRHNIGFMAADQIARQHGFTSFRSKHNGHLADGEIDGQRTLLLKPQTFMNRSGDSVAAAAKFFKIAPEDVIVLYDELDLVPGKIRVKIGGGNGGHNGLRSIDPQLGLNYKRVRLGIGHPGKEFVTHHVLGDFAKADQVWLDPLLDAIAKNIGLLVKGDDAGFMNKIALATKPDAEPKQASKAQSHIRQARSTKPAVPAPSSGPMAAMLKKLFGDG
ncbi:aminoacyl-tRNA hydrolase [Devosia rhodophyticola]|uniref:Peptidyl-tRNA hydrolase n=1 Tax=Devosia rhodophyticola TaxID=3026423 RepID=A0ABY7YV39_9HYPH|nr:aminoacyl-tRNA hydrolase [Devosia rhodophyticola]WDR05072.1 aminoacyl-tRNA hydrolase [Devosia rhodophyticola]